jgi:hypothetical protein
VPRRYVHLIRLLGGAGFLGIAAAVAILGPASSEPVARLATLAATPAGVRFVPIDGGPRYFARISPLSAWMDGHILLGAWMEQPESLADVRRDAAMGDNIYWSLGGTIGQDRVEYNVIRQGGMHVSAPSEDADTGPETVSWDGDDEADMRFGPGTGEWDNGDSEPKCVPSGAACGYTDADFYYADNRKRVAGDRRLPYRIDGRAIQQGSGKGVLFWEPAASAARFLDYSDILSADSYWLTDNDLQNATQGGCGIRPRDETICRGGTGTGLDYPESHLAANYAFNVTRLRSLEALDGRSKPIVVDVETGCPFSTGDSAGDCAEPRESVAAAWHALIAGARGIAWFQHNFSGPCLDDRTFLDGSNPHSAKYSCQQTPGVTLHDVVEAISTFNHEVASLNDVLLSPTAENYVRTPDDVSVMAKAYRGTCYVFAASGKPASPPFPDQTVSFTVAGAYTGPVLVFDEHRRLYADGGTFHDTFADSNAVHIYQIPDRAFCTGT